VIKDPFISFLLQEPPEEKDNPCIDPLLAFGWDPSDGCHPLSNVALVKGEDSYMCLKIMGNPITNCLRGIAFGQNVVAGFRLTVAESTQQVIGPVFLQKVICPVEKKLFPHYLTRSQ
jgi:hypothetical protein